MVGSWLVHGWFMVGSWLVHGWFMVDLIATVWMAHKYNVDGDPLEMFVHGHVVTVHNQISSIEQAAINIYR